MPGTDVKIVVGISIIILISFILYLIIKYKSKWIQLLRFRKEQKRKIYVDICNFCGSKLDIFDRNCKYCGIIFCQDHRLPENHDCSGNPTNPHRSFREIHDSKGGIQAYGK